MTLSPIVTRAELIVVRGLESQFIENWVKGGNDEIPQMPHLVNLGRGIRFHLPSVDKWLLEYFQVGGVKK